LNMPTPLYLSKMLFTDVQLLLYSKKKTTTTTTSEKPVRSAGINSGKKACYICGSYKHLANQCEERGRSRWRDNNPRDVPRKEIAACQTTAQRELTKGGKEERYRERSVNIPSCGRVPVVAAVTGNVESTVREEILKDVRRNYVGDGTINGQSVTFMRDTGSSFYQHRKDRFSV